MATAKKTTEKTTEPVEVEATEVATVDDSKIDYEVLSPEMKAIYDEAERLEAEMEAEFQKKAAPVTAMLLAKIKNMQKTAGGLTGIRAMIQELYDTDKALDDQLEELERVSALTYDVIVTLVGDKMASKFLKDLDGERLAFGGILRTVFQLTNVGKA